MTASCTRYVLWPRAKRCRDELTLRKRGVSAVAIAEAMLHPASRADAPSVHSVLDARVGSQVEIALWPSRTFFGIAVTLAHKGATSQGNGLRFRPVPAVDNYAFRRPRGYAVTGDTAD